MNYKIALIRGDGIGPEVVGEAVKVLEAVGQKFGHSFTYEEVLLGGCATDAVGKSYPDGTAEKCRACDAVLLGAVGGPKWGSDKPAEQRPETALLAIRKDLGLYANLLVKARLELALCIKEYLDRMHARPRQYWQDLLKRLGIEACC